MTNKVTKDEAETKPTLDAWAMSTSILVGIRQAIQVAQSERDAALEAGNQAPFAPGVSKAGQIIRALTDAERCLSPDLHRIARSNSLPMPDLK